MLASFAAIALLLNPALIHAMPIPVHSAVTVYEPGTNRITNLLHQHRARLRPRYTLLAFSLFKNQFDRFEPVADYVIRNIELEHFIIQRKIEEKANLMLSDFVTALRAYQDRLVELKGLIQEKDNAGLWSAATASDLEAVLGTSNGVWPNAQVQEFYAHIVERKRAGFDIYTIADEQQFYRVVDNLEAARELPSAVHQPLEQDLANVNAAIQRGVGELAADELEAGGEVLREVNPMEIGLELFE